MGSTIESSFVSGTGASGATNIAGSVASSLTVLTWRNVMYEVSSLEWNAWTKLPERVPRVILNNLNGSFRTGEMTAVLGPSGSGKTTLFECLLGRRNSGTDGLLQVVTQYPAQGKAGLQSMKGVESLSVAFVPQRESLLLRFTVEEALMYASMLKNPTARGHEHRRNVIEVVTRIRLVDALQQRIEKLSTGQKKLISVAQELLSRPKVLIVDEPTSNLDSTTAGLVLNVLKSLTKPLPSSGIDSVAVLASIHQPSSKIFLLFDKIYCISSTGRCMYEGPPQQVLPTLNSIGLQCPPYYNVAEYLLEAASGELGQDKLSSLYSLHAKAWSGVSYDGKRSIQLTSRNNPLVKAVSNAKHPFWHDTWIIIRRSACFTWRDPLLMGLRLGSYLGIALFMSFLHKRAIGLSDGCPWVIQPPINWSMYDVMDIVLKANIIVRDTKELLENAAYSFMHISIITLSVLSVTVMSFPLEVPALRTELYNGWYSSSSYLVGRTVAELPFQFTFTFIYVATTYWFTHQIREWWRFACISLVYIFCSFVAQSYAQVVGAFFLKNLAQAVFGTSIALIPQVIFGSFLIKNSDMRAGYQPLNYLSFFRYTFKAIIALTYGYDRCVCDMPERPGTNLTANALMLECTDDCMDEFSGGLIGMFVGKGAMKKFISQISVKHNPLFVESCDKDEYLPAPLVTFKAFEGEMWQYMAALALYWLVTRILGFIILRWRLQSYRG